MRHLSLSIPSLEIALLRRGVGDRSARNQHCRDCGRSPLVGEHVYAYANGRVCCELCRALRRDEPVSSALVHGPEHGNAVRVRVRTAA
jgi:hypothetical protein